MKSDEAGDFWLSYYCFIKHGTLPSSFAETSIREKAIIKAFIDIEAENAKKSERR